jgi:Secretory lipase
VPRLRAATAVFAGSLFLGATVPAVSAGATDPFIAATATELAAAPGTIVRARSITLRGTFGERLAYPAWQLAYRTTDATGAPTVTAATVVRPVRRTSGPRRLLAYQMAYDGLAMKCRPSVRLRNGHAPEGSLRKALDRGWTVVTADYEGPQDAWIAGRMAGHAVLDAARAAEQFPQLGLAGTETAVGLAGYSGGGQATAWASELAATYAPELRIVGAAQGGVPANPRLLAGSLDGGPFAGVMLGAIAGLSAGYPNIDVLGELNAAGRRAVRNTTKLGCIASFALAAPATRLRDLTIDPAMLDRPQIKQILADNTLGAAPPTVPTLMYHASDDHLVAITGARALARSYCNAGVRLTWQEGTGDHIGLPLTIGDLPLRYLQHRFDGLPVRDSCAGLRDAQPPTAAQSSSR